MSAASTALRTGVARGGIEFRQSLTTGLDLWTYLFPSLVALITVFFMRDARVPGTEFSLGASTLPGFLGMNLALTGLATVAQLLVTDREDGTLLRAKAVPTGMSGYLIGKIVLVGGMALVGFVLQLVPALFVVDGLQLDANGWLTLCWLIPLALVATMPLGAVLGSIFDNPRSIGLIMFTMFGLIAISGIFYPITALPGWLQGLGQVFPIYWMGLGMRSAFLPDAMAAVELGGSWRTLEGFGVLGLWAVLGLLLAPVVLRRMARRESGSAVAARREKAMSRAPM
ncbi:ABC transporter permease [Jidongwangia harbinensis]|uniref:ABC transporter permease n=1 Tax=Jidongwangia harbinensis TaxID=2878561 RepID=UPI001CD972E1|nr:ABC transporter permease [Jidongwangia harbinensis]MCA2217241.1 ABC transporter permease [Jidongwangia harbinensis]